MSSEAATLPETASEAPALLRVRVCDACEPLSGRRRPRVSELDEIDEWLAFEKALETASFVVPSYVPDISTAVDELDEDDEALLAELYS